MVTPDRDSSGVGRVIMLAKCYFALEDDKQAMVTIHDALGLEPAVDSTNRSPRFRRNRVRNEVLPLLGGVAERDVTPLITRAAELLRSDDDLLEALACDVDPRDARALAAAPLPLARRAVRRWLTSDGYPPDSASVARVLDVAAGRTEACQVVGGRRVQRSGQRLSLLPSAR